jgi:hypothetical protein
VPFPHLVVGAVEWGHAVVGVWRACRGHHGLRRNAIANGARCPRKRARREGKTQSPGGNDHCPCCRRTGSLRGAFQWGSRLLGRTNAGEGRRGSGLATQVR